MNLILTLKALTIHYQCAIAPTTVFAFLERLSSYRRTTLPLQSNCGYLLAYNKDRQKGPTEIWTRIAGFRVLSANHYTMGPSNILLCWFLRRSDLSDRRNYLHLFHHLELSQTIHHSKMILKGFVAVDQFGGERRWSNQRQYVLVRDRWRVNLYPMTALSPRVVVVLILQARTDLQRNQ